MDIKKFWDNAVTYEEYLKRAKRSAEMPETQVEKDYHEYYKLGVQRMQRMGKTYIPDPEQLKTLARKNFKGKILIISEAWCGDASAAIPVITRFFENNEIRITYRDQEPSLINDFLTKGSKSIPVVLFLDDDYKVIAHWGPRPKFGLSLFIKHKKDPQNYNDEQFHNDMQVYYARNKGMDTIEEILELL